jgi:hypothetical protein
VPGSHAEDIVVDYFETEDWAALDDAESEPDLELPAASTATSVDHRPPRQ